MNALTPEQTEQLATEHAVLADTIAQAQTRQKEIKAILADLGAGNHDAGPFTVQVTVPQRFDEIAAAKAFPFETAPQFYGVKFDRKAFEHGNAPAVVEHYKKAGNPTVTVK